MSLIEIIPAVMPQNRHELFQLTQTIRPFTKTAQLDIMDGDFAKGISYPLKEEDFVGLTLPFPDELFWEVHLMVQNPGALGEHFIHAGAKRIIAHVEAFGGGDAARETFEAWHASGAQAGVSILLETPISAIEGVFYDVEVVQVMGIAEIGVQGNPFDERAIVRVRELRNRFPQAVIAVDGGVTAHNAKALAGAGANRLCVGSAILKAKDPRAAYEELLTTVQNV